MRTAIIPAQIITVEDKIAGNLSLSQISILMIPLIFAMLIYIFPPSMKFTLFKIVLVCVLALTSIFLATRIKEKIIFHWLIILLRYYKRPGYYLFNKNDVTERIVNMPVMKNPKKEKPTNITGNVQQTKCIKTTDLITFEKFLLNPTKRLRFTINKKGGLTVAIDQIK